MTKLSALLNDTLINQLKEKITQREFAGIDFEAAMKFILSDGVIPNSGLPVNSFLKLEDWLRASDHLTYTTTQLKNQTGEILEQVMHGRVVKLTRHGRVVAEIKGV